MSCTREGNSKLTRRGALVVMSSLVAAGCALRPLADHDSQASFNARSPNGKLRATIAVAPHASDGAVVWEVSCAGRAVILPSVLGLVLSDGRCLGMGARIVGHRLL